MKRKKVKKVTKVKTKASIKRQKNEEFKKKKALFKQRIINSTLFVPNYEKQWIDKKMSWFGISKLKYEVTNPLINDPDPTLYKDELLRSEQIGINFTDDQKQLILRWMELARIIYNITVFYFRHNDLVSFKIVRPHIRRMFNDKLIQDIKESNLPAHVLDNAIHDAIKAYSSSIGLVKAGIIKHFRIRYKKQSKPTKTIVIESADFNVTNSFYSRSLNEYSLNKFIDDNQDKPKKELQKLIKKQRELLSNFDTSIKINKKNIHHDTRLCYDSLKDVFLLKVPRDRRETILKPKIQYCGIDPGNITNLTIYSQGGKCYKIANRNNINMLYKLTNKKLLAKRLIHKYKLAKYKRFFKRISDKIQNLTKELHYKSALYICRKFDKIYLGKLSTKSITSKKKNMSALEKEFTYALSHDKFRTILTNKAQEYGRELSIVDESFTSQSCGCCGNLTKVGLSRVYECRDCKSRLDRDLNAARNILIKHLK